MHVVFVVGTYPSIQKPTGATFVRSMVRAIARQGHVCTVVNPVSVFSRRFGPFPAAHEEEQQGEGKIEIHRPRFLSFSVKNLGVMNTALLTQEAFNRAVLRVVRKLSVRPDIIYGHFLYQAGYAAVIAGRVLCVPSIAGVGEGAFWTVEPIGFEKAKKHMSEATGFLAVSSFVRNGLIEGLDVRPERIRVFPNGVDMSLFFPRDRSAMRQKHGFPKEKPILAFVGTFDHLKGGARLLEAASSFPEVRILLLGQGAVRLDSPQVLFKGTIPNELIPEFLSASDLFTLPTTEEGSCNAILEAMACGLPMVTSDGAYMDDIVDGEVALRVDPMNVSQIRSAIGRLLENARLRASMSAACLNKVRQYDINLRAQRMLDWYSELKENFHSSHPGRVEH